MLTIEKLEKYQEGCWGPGICYFYATYVSKSAFPSIGGFVKHRCVHLDYTYTADSGLERELQKINQLVNWGKDKPWFKPLKLIKRRNI